MDVKKIFKLLIGVVACVVIGAIVLNVLLPNATTALIDAVEGQIYNATGMSFDFNGNGTVGSAASGTQSYDTGAGITSDEGDVTVGVDGIAP